MYWSGLHQYARWVFSPVQNYLNKLFCIEAHVYALVAYLANRLQQHLLPIYICHVMLCWCVCFAYTCTWKPRQRTWLLHMIRSRVIWLIHVWHDTFEPGSHQRTTTLQRPSVAFLAVSTNHCQTWLIRVVRWLICTMRHDAFMLHVSFHKRATHHRALLREMTYKDKTPYASLSPCIMCERSYPCEIWLISHVMWHDSYTTWRDSFMRDVTHSKCDVTHSRFDVAYLCVIWWCERTISCVAWRCVTWLIHNVMWHIHISTLQSAMPHSRMTWLIHVWHYQFTCEMTY